jgi:anti-sigma28 factor (negative regulator of flagellin synthesis)
MGDEQGTMTTPTATATPAAEAPKAKKKPGRKPGKKAADGKIPMWQKMGWNKPGRPKGGPKKAAKKAAKKSAKKAAKRPAKKTAKKATRTASTPVRRNKVGRPRAAAPAAAQSAGDGDVRTLLVAAIKQSVDNGDFENARQILDLLEKQR